MRLNPKVVIARLTPAQIQAYRNDWNDIPKSHLVDEIHLRGMIQAKRIISDPAEQKFEYLITWFPKNIIIDQWLPIEAIEKNAFKTLKISQLNWKTQRLVHMMLFGCKMPYKNVPFFQK